MGVALLGRHTCPGCNLGYCRDLFFVLNDVDHYTVRLNQFTSSEVWVFMTKDFDLLG